MRIALLTEDKTANTVYRSIGPLRGLGERGYEVRELDPDQIRTWHDAVPWCDLLHIHRACEAQVVELARAAKAAGAAVVWDDDDDVTQSPPGTPAHGMLRGLNGTKRLAARSRLFEVADLVTTPSAFLADVFRGSGAREVRVIENCVVDAFVCRPVAHSGVHVGWVAGSEHHLDAKHLGMAGVLERLLAEHPSAHVTTIGVRLGIASERYTHIPRVPLIHLLERVATFDVGIAPLSEDIAINHSRSNIKLKEYAAVEVPWLASPIGPYTGLGERQGGRLVANDRWFQELSALVGGHRVRRKLARRAARWGRGQLLSRNLDGWEKAFAHAVALAAQRREAGDGRPLQKTA